MISVNQAFQIHELLINKFGGATGVRDPGALESALARAFQTFSSEDLYPSAIEKAAAIGESLIVNHPFVDGNKRTGYVILESLLRYEGLIIVSTDAELYDFVLRISTGETDFKEIVNWLSTNTQSRENSV